MFITLHSWPSQLFYIGNKPPLEWLPSRAVCLVGPSPWQLFSELEVGESWVEALQNTPNKNTDLSSVFHYRMKLMLRSNGQGDIAVRCCKFDPQRRQKYVINCGFFNPLSGELNPTRHLLALVGDRHIVHVYWTQNVRFDFSPQIFSEEISHSKKNWARYDLKICLSSRKVLVINTLIAELNPIRHLLALVKDRHIVPVYWTQNVRFDFSLQIFFWRNFSF